MSRDVDYLLDYFGLPYKHPTPMELDKQLILKEIPKAKFTVMANGYLVYCKLPKYSLSEETISKLKADSIFEKINGDDIRDIKRATK